MHCMSNYKTFDEMLFVTYCTMCNLTTLTIMLLEYKRFENMHVFSKCKHLVMMNMHKKWSIIPVTYGSYSNSVLVEVGWVKLQWWRLWHTEHSSEPLICFFLTVCNTAL